MLVLKIYLWLINFIIALLTAINVIAWGYAIRSVGNPEFSLRFIIKLILNKWYLLAISAAFVSSLLSYTILRSKGVLAGRYFLSLSHVATILTAVLVLGENLKPIEWIGLILVVIGVILIGRS